MTRSLQHLLTGIENITEQQHVFEQWCYQRMLKISWKDKVSNTDVLKRIREKEPRFYKETAQQKHAYGGHILGEVVVEMHW